MQEEKIKLWLKAGRISHQMQMWRGRPRPRCGPITNYVVTAALGCPAERSLAVIA